MLLPVPLVLSDGGNGDHLLHVVLISFLSLIFGGWFTVILAALTGAVLGLLQQRLLALTHNGSHTCGCRTAGCAKTAFRRRPYSQRVRRCWRCWPW
ncbi:MAG: hypothetical protein R2873_28725 [Caldilineaceae bacterium]